MKNLKRLLALFLAVVLIAVCFSAETVMAHTADADKMQATASETINIETTNKQDEDSDAADYSANLSEKEIESNATDHEIVVSKAAESSALLMSSGSSGSEIGGGGGGGDSAGSGSSNMVAVGVTMQIVYYRYDKCYNRFNSHASVIDTLKSGNAIPWNSTGKDSGELETTVFDTFTISPHTFIVKAQWDSYPYVYHFPNENLNSDDCKFSWSGFTNYWFKYDNPGGKASTYPRIVRNETNGSYAIEQYLARIILGSEYGAWDKTNIARGETAEDDSSLYADVLKYLGASDLAVQNYLDAYFGKLSIAQDGSTLIPTIIWSWVGAENLGGTNRIYTIGDVAASGSSNTKWLQTAYTSPMAANSDFGSCTWMKGSADTMICKAMMGGKHSTSHSTVIWTGDGCEALFGTGYVNRIQTQVDSTQEDGANTFYYLRGYWTPYGSGNGSVSLTKTDPSGSEKLSDAQFTLYRDEDCLIPVTDADYDTLSYSDKGYVSTSIRKTDSSGQAEWTGLYTGIYFLKETKAPDGYIANMDTDGNVEVREIAVSNGMSELMLTNSPAKGKICIIKMITNKTNGTSIPEAGAKFLVTDSNGITVDTIVTDEDGKGESKELPYGTYKVSQISGVHGTIYCDSWNAVINQSSSAPVFEKEDPLWTASVSVHKEESGAKKPLTASFELCERQADDTVKVLESGTTDRNGNLTFSKKIVYEDGACSSSTYFVRETAAPKGYVLDAKEYPVSCTSDNQEIYVTVENAPIIGSVEIHKRSSDGESMKGVRFLLEYSTDNGGTWNHAAKGTDNSLFSAGSCTSESLDANGTLLTDINGILCFEGLRVYDSDGNPVRYRVTELETLTGFSLIPGHIWEGSLSDQSDVTENYKTVLDVVNSPILELPNTGSNSMLILAVMASLFAIVGAALLMVCRRKVH